MLNARTQGNITTKLLSPGDVETACPGWDCVPLEGASPSLGGATGVASVARSAYFQLFVLLAMATLGQRCLGPVTLCSDTFQIRLLPYTRAALEDMS